MTIKTFYTSDTHFSHHNIIKYSNRPFKDVEEMNEAIVSCWNETVSETDIVFHLGDVAMGDKSSWDGVLSRLNGHKILVVGNHEAIFGANKEAYRQRHAHHYDVFDEIQTNIRGEWLADGTIVDLSHFPYDGDSHDGDRYTEYRLADTGRTLIHGHTHAEYAKHGMDARLSRSKRGTLQVHVGIDAWEYRPVSEDEIISLLDTVR